MENPAFKILMRLTKGQLIYKANRYKLITTKQDKLSLAKAIAEFESEQFSRNWATISNG